MHHNGVTLLLHPPQQLPHPALAHAHPLRSFSLRHPPVPRSFHPLQPVSLLLAHCDSFHPSALRLSIGTFYLAELGTSHLAATWAFRGGPVFLSIRDILGPHCRTTS